MTNAAAILALGLTTISAVADQRSGTISNALTVGAFACSLMMAFVERTIGAALLGAAVGGLIPLFLFLRDRLGGGDLKLFIVLGSLLGCAAVLAIELFVSVASVFLLPRRIIVPLAPWILLSTSVVLGIYDLVCV